MAHERSSYLDKVYVLGDFSLDKRAVERYLKRLNGHKHLIAGNHDACFKSLTKSSKTSIIEKYIKWGFETVKLSDTYYSNSLDIEINLSHFPYKGTGDRTYEERYSEYRLEDTRQVLLHGHSHNPWYTRCRMTDKGSLMIDVGVDANHYKPVRLQEIEDIISDFYND